MKARSATQIISKIHCPFLSLHKGDGYWYFVYDAPARGVYETRSVMVMYLNSMDLDQWVAEGRELKKIGDDARRERFKESRRSREGFSEL